MGEWGFPVVVGVLGLVLGRVVIARALDWQPGAGSHWGHGSSPWAVAVALALSWALLGWDLGPSIPWLCLAVLTLLLAAISVIDMAWRIIPNGLLAAGTLPWLAGLVAQASGLVSSPVTGEVARLVADRQAATLAARGIHAQMSAPWAASLWRATGLDPWACEAIDGLVASVGVMALLLAMGWIVRRLTGGAAVGGGDVKLLGLVALYLGCIPTLACLMVSCVLGLLSAWRHRGEVPDGQDAAGEKTDPGGRDVGGGGAGSRGQGDAAGEAGPRSRATFPWAPAIALSYVICQLAGPLLV